ncbi:cation:proton antiporter subunit C [Methanogenium marinum]|uniref:Cation:proton antiporter subunit C n=1 Tax=Methanogenium marinum TaxID=348610 RepID=A0A9Q4KUD8_9EURY|nr:cation:proton antiporter subunit C [Methanogenium marinum]MDE4907431.1 cation:proton antiporter subunit C [Methanogenium marinum]
MIENVPYFCAGILVIIGLVVIVTKKDMIKMVMGLALVEAGVNLLLVATGFISGGVAPIFTNAPSTAMVMPTVQAMTLTNIVIGIATTALLLSFVMVISKKYGTRDVTEMRRLKE